MKLNAEKENIFFVSDLHLNHNNIIRFSNRPFNDVHEMNEGIKKDWNSVVGKEDHVFVLGDVALGRDKDATNILYGLNGYLYLIKGNHEKAVLSNENNKKRFEWIDKAFLLKVKDSQLRENGKNLKEKYIYMHHYSCRVWDKSHHGSWHLYGHSHDSLDKDNVWGKSMDVGVDSAYRILGEYRPFSYEEVKNILKRRDTKIIDHHK